MSDRLAEMLSAYMHRPSPAALGVLGDYLEDKGLLRIKRMLLGVCVECGGRMRRCKPGWAIDSDYYQCKKCGETDSEYLKFHSSHFLRAMRNLGFVMCVAEAHYHNENIALFASERTISPCLVNPVKCARCNSLGIRRR